jgi:hypothetical protein
MLKLNPQGWFFRIVVALVGLSLLSIGMVPLIHNGDLFFANWFGGLLFAPLAILGGLFIIFCAIFRPEWLEAKYSRRK